MCFRVSALSCLVCLTCAGCTVKEDRGDCPCSLHLDIDGPDVFGSVDLSWLIRNSGAGAVSAFDKLPEVLSLDVPRCLGDVCVNVCEEGLLDEDGGLVIELGEDCPPVYFCKTEVDCRSEYVEEVVALHKNYSELTCVLEHSESLGIGLNYCIAGNICGYDADGTPRTGPFRCSLNCRRNSSGMVLANVGLPRQSDSSLTLDVTAPDGELLREFALGEYIAASGYDWDAQSLEDIVIRIDIATTSMDVEVFSGNKEIHLSYVI